MKLSGVRPSVCPSVCPIIRPPHARCGGFAAVGPAARRCRSTAAANASSATLSADVGSWTRKLCVCVCVCVAGVHALRPHRGQCIVANRFRSLLPSSIHPSQISGQHLAVYTPGCSSGSNSDDLYRATATTYAFSSPISQLRCPISCPVDASRYSGMWLDLTTSPRQRGSSAPHQRITQPTS